MTNLAIATSIVSRLQQLGYTTYFAGGWVRDFLLNFPSDDIDIATQAPIEVIQAVFPKTLAVGISFGIIIVVEEGEQFEVATFRKERDYVDGRRPSSVEPCPPEEDAKRRDFTINGLFYDPIKQQLHDFVHGEKDIKAGIIRAIGNPIDRFQEDRLRMLRAIRYSTRFGFQIDPNTQLGIVQLAHELLPAVSAERIYQEIQKMDLFDTLAPSLRLLAQHHLLKVIFPELSHQDDESLLAAIGMIDHLPKQTPLVAKLSLLFSHMPLQEKLASLNRLKLSRKELSFISYLDQLKQSFNSIAIDDYLLAHLYADEFFPLAISFFKHLKGHQKEAIHAERHANYLVEHIKRIKEKRPLISSQILAQENIPPGKLMGLLMKEGEKIAINEKLTDCETVLKKLKSLDIWPLE